MALIDQEQAARQIRGNKIQIEADCADTSYNLGCEASARIVERIRGQEIIHCKDCAYHGWDLVDGPYGLAQEIHWCDKHYDEQGENLKVLPNDFCNWADRRGEE